MIAGLLAFVRLEPADRRLVAEAAMLIVPVRLGLTLLRFATVRRALSTCTAIFGLRSSDSPATASQIAWAVRTVARRLPIHTSCLVEGLVGEAMLQRRGLAAALRLGVRRPDGAPFEAHAWVECNGEVVIGDLEDLARFVPLSPRSSTVAGLSVR